MFTLSIEDTVEVPVKFILKEGKVNKTYTFSLTARRMANDELTEAFKAVEFKYKEFFETTGVVSDWQGQRLVLDADRNPAPFSAEAFSYMLNVTGVAAAIYAAYAKESGVKEKN